jgi:hypothetical protein
MRGFDFATAYHNEMAIQLVMLWAAMSSIVVGEMLGKFWE